VSIAWFALLLALIELGFWVVGGAFAFRWWRAGAGERHHQHLHSPDTEGEE